MAPGYPYRPLNSARKEIRVLRFQRQDTFGDKPLQACIEHISLLEVNRVIPRYYAISYTWGDARTRKDIVIDGITVDIPVNAELALRYLHRGDKTLALGKTRLTDMYAWNELDFSERWVWIDSICINQNDLNERNLQVSMMGQVYSCAYLVLIWLGEDIDGKAASALKSIHDVWHLARETTDDFRNFHRVVNWRDFGNKRTRGDQSGSSAMDVIPLGDVDWLGPVDPSALVSFFSSPWFSRVWVLQESILSREAYCFKGHLHCDWREVVLVAKWISRLAPSDTVRLKSIMNISRAAHMFDHWSGVTLVREPSDSAMALENLENLLLMATEFQATDPRDKVFAILPLLGHYPDSLTPDYGLSVAEIYTRACRAAILGKKTLNLAIAARLIEHVESDSTLSLPSWVLRFVESIKPGDGIRVIDARVSPGPELVDLFDVDDAGTGSILRVKGFVIDEVGCEPCPSALFKGWVTERASDWSIQPIIDLRLAWLTAREHLPSYPETDLLNDLFTTLAADRPTNFRAASGECGRADVGFRAYMHDLVDLTTVEDGEKARRRATDNDRGSAALTLADRALNRCFFVTKDNRIGTGFPKTRRGDQICLLFGAFAPVILRPDGDYWTLIGDAYVSGVKNGEFVNQLREEGRFENEIRSFDIR